MKKNLLKLKIENIAQNLFNTNQKYNTDLKEEANINQLSSDESTIKDSVSEFEEKSKSIHSPINKNQKNKVFENLKHSSLQSGKHQSSLYTKTTSLTENNSINGTFEYNINSDSNKQNKDKSEIKENSNMNINIDNKISYKEMINKNEIAKINKVNIYKINEIKNIYFDLLEIFHSQKIQEKNSPEFFKSISNEIKFLSFNYIKFVFSEDMELLINIFNDNIEINKYFIIEIYFFISIIYLFNEKTLNNNYLLISYKSSLFYSIINFENVMNILKKPFSPNNDKLLKDIKSTNKIILPILKIININIPSNSQLKDFISPSEINNKNSSNNKSGIAKLISSLKENENLKLELKNLSKLEKKIKAKEIIRIQIDEEQEKEIIPILPLIDTKKYKYSIGIELDETLVHYCEEGDNYYAKVRFGSENFLKNLSNFFEIIVISTSGKEYSNIIIDNLNKDGKCYVEQRLFIEDFKENQDLSKINRDLSKIIFVCHNYDFINAPKENIILLKEFLGEEEDREIVKLYHELKQFISNYNNINDENFDIRKAVPGIIERINFNYENEEILDEEDEK